RLCGRGCLRRRLTRRNQPLGNAITEERAKLLWIEQNGRIDDLRRRVCGTLLEPGISRKAETIPQESLVPGFPRVGEIRAEWCVIGYAGDRVSGIEIDEHGSHLRVGRAKSANDRTDLTQQSQQLLARRFSSRSERAHRKSLDNRHEL